MDKLYSAVEAAEELTKWGRTGNAGTPYSRVSVAYMARKHSIGQKVGNRWVFTVLEVHALFDLPRRGDHLLAKPEPEDESPSPAEEVSPEPTAAPES